MAEHAAAWPLKKMPVLVDGDRTVVEASIIVEYLDLYHPGRVRFVPADPRAALDVRTMDRICDNYVMTPMQSDRIRHDTPARAARMRRALPKRMHCSTPRTAG